MLAALPPRCRSTAATLPAGDAEAPEPWVYRYLLHSEVARGTEAAESPAEATGAEPKATPDTSAWLLKLILSGMEGELVTVCRHPPCALAYS